MIFKRGCLFIWFFLGLAGCGNQKLPTSKPVVIFGDYEIVYKAAKARITLKSDNTFRQIVLLDGQRKIYLGSFRLERARAVAFSGIWQLCDERGDIVKPVKPFNGIVEHTIATWYEMPHLIINPEIEGAFYIKVSKPTIN